MSLMLDSWVWRGQTRGVFWSSQAQHPGTQLRGALYSGPRNSCSGMLFWPRSLLKALGQIFFDAFVPKFATSAYDCALAVALKSSSKPLFGRFLSRGLLFPLHPSVHHWGKVAHGPPPHGEAARYIKPISDRGQHTHTHT